MRKIIIIIITFNLTNCNSQTENIDTNVLKTLKDENFEINNIDFVIALTEIEYLLKNDEEANDKWGLKNKSEKNNSKRYRSVKIANHYLKKYIAEYGNPYMKEKLNFIENIDDSNIENINYTFNEAPVEEIVGFYELDFLFYAFFLKDKFFTIVEKDKSLQKIYSQMIDNDSFILYLILFDTTLCEHREFRRRKIEFLKERFKDCETLFGKSFLNEIKKIDVDKDY